MRRRWKILMAVAGFFVLISGSLVVTQRIEPGNELGAYQMRLRVRGEKLDLAEVLPSPMAPEDNAAGAVEQAFALFGSGTEEVPDAMTMVAPGRALAGWSQPDVRGYDFTNTWDEFAARVEAGRPAIELLQQVLPKPTLEFESDYKEGAQLLLPHLAPLKRAAQKLTAAAILELHNRDDGAAATNILTLLDLVHKNAMEGLLISHLVRMAMTEIAVAPTWELLQTTNVTDAQLAAVQKGWQQLNFLGDVESVFVTERAWWAQEIQKARASHPAYEEVIGSDSANGGPTGGHDFMDRARATIGEIMWRSSWSYADELDLLKRNQIILEAVRAMQTNRSGDYKADFDDMAARLSKLAVTRAGGGFFRALDISNPGGFWNGDWNLSIGVQKTLRMEAARNVVVAAIALKRFQLKNGQWPESLAEVVPEFLPAVPIDPYDGKPLRYHPNVEGTYWLYCVAKDGVDDGGDPTCPPSAGSSSLYWLNFKARDWVWPQPATAAEGQFFYEHRPKK
jgi:hypothetical protein